MEPFVLLTSMQADIIAPDMFTPET